MHSGRPPQQDDACLAAADQLHEVGGYGLARGLEDVWTRGQPPLLLAHLIASIDTHLTPNVANEGERERTGANGSDSLNRPRNVGSVKIKFKSDQSER